MHWSWETKGQKWRGLPKGEAVSIVIRVQGVIYQSQSLYIGSADEFSTSTSCPIITTGFVRPAFDGNKRRSAQSVRPFVQNSSWNASARWWRRRGIYTWMPPMLVKDHQDGWQTLLKMIWKGQTRLKLWKSFDTKVQNEEFLLLSFYHHPLEVQRREICSTNLLNWHREHQICWQPIQYLVSISACSTVQP